MAWSDCYVVHDVVTVGLIAQYILLLLYVRGLPNIVNSIASFSVLLLRNAFVCI